MLNLSVVVCTYNRSFLLNKCLDSLVKQNTYKNNFEVVVIDNGSNDGTKELLNLYIKKYKNFKYFLEENQGLSHARNRGYKESIGKYVAYIDDDAIADKNWVKNIINLTKKYPEINVFGGPYYRYFTKKVPNWFPKEYGIYFLGNKEKLINVPIEYVSGPNMIFSKFILEKTSGFDINLGMCGKNLGYGEEVNLQIKLKGTGEKIMYSPKIKVKHLVADYKLSLWWLLKSNYSDGKTTILTFSKKTNIFLLLLGFGKAIIFSFIIFFRNINKPLKYNLYLSLKKIFSKSGELIFYLKKKV